jgi:hypothetical protein
MLKFAAVLLFVTTLWTQSDRLLQRESGHERYSYVITSSDRRSYFRMTSAYSTELERITHQGFAASATGSELWRTDGWYSWNTFLSCDGRHLAVLDMVELPYANSGRGCALVVLDRGRIVSRYALDELPMRAATLRSPEPWWRRAGISDADGSLVVETRAGISIVVDLATGAVRAGE